LKKHTHSKKHSLRFTQTKKYKGTRPIGYYRLQTHARASKTPWKDLIPVGEFFLLKGHLAESVPNYLSISFPSYVL
jgi:hypothetical protein